MIQPERVKVLKKVKPEKSCYVLYWMQASQRAEYNHALEFALRKANEYKLPLLVYFGLTDSYPDANMRHYRFMLEGLKQTAARLKERGINFVLKKESPQKGIVKLAENAAATVFDTGYMPVQRQWRKVAADAIDGPVFQVESDVIVPVCMTSPKEEYAAYTIRPKIQKQCGYFLQPLECRELKVKTVIDVESVNQELAAPQNLATSMNINKTVTDCEQFHPGGITEAESRLKNFIDNKLSNYSELRNEPAQDFQSGLSPYLHFGQISPLQVALKIQKSKNPGAEDFLEELIVRRELAMNFAQYNDFCQNYRALPPWAVATLEEHSKDRRSHIYPLADLEGAATADPYWNAAQNEMLICGKMHGYMRMYWGKMLLQWSETPRQAFERALYLNDKYELDGRDPNSCAGIAWCFGKHDRPWPEHPVVGKVRLMNHNGLKRKFDMQSYVEKIDKLKKS
jgi:deoxyribodipyrimidine photo-lyase